MAQFDESKVINALHPEKAEIGKKYYFSDYIVDLKAMVECTDKSLTTKKGTLTQIIERNKHCPFCILYSKYAYLYPYEESSKQIMTNRQLSEWLAKGNGQISYITLSGIYVNHAYINHAYENQEDNEYVSDSIRIRSWDSEEWIEPTVDIYERDCKML